MIRVTFLLRRKPGLERAAFYDYWLNSHGPLVASVAHDLGMLRYVQVHTLGDPADAGMAEARGGMEPVYDGVAEVWFESRDSFVKTLETDTGKTAGARLIEDEKTFIDLANSPLWLAYEYPQVNPTPENLVATQRSSLVKLYFPLRSKPALTEADMQAYWRTHHGPIIRRQAAGSGILRYVQVHRALDEPLQAVLTEPRGTVVEPYTGHAELWFDRAALAGSTPERRLAGERAIADEATFIDFSRSAMWLAKEHVFVDHR